VKLEELIDRKTLLEARPAAEHCVTAIIHGTTRVLSERGLFGEESTDMATFPPRILAALIFFFASCQAVDLNPDEAYMALKPFADSPDRAAIREQDIGTRRETFAARDVNPFNKH
jgi:hypothetical protein